MPRSAALAVLQRWNPQRNNLDDLVSGALTPLPPRDAALARHLCESCVLHLRLLDHWIDQLAARRAIEPMVRDILRIGLAQLRFSRIPAYAALDRTTSLAPPRARGFVNALLRRATRDPDALAAWEQAAPPAVRFSLTNTLWQHWLNHHGSDTATKLAAASQHHAPLVFRINDFIPAAVTTISSCVDVHPLPEYPGFFTHVGHVPAAWFANGWVLAQDPATAMATDLLAPQPGESILDACASPGGKSQRIAALTCGRAALTATDLPERLPRLRDNLARWNLSGISIVAADWCTPGPAPIPSAFDAVLVDAPCSNTGVLRRRLDARHRFSAASLAAVVSLQQTILNRCAALVTPGGRMVYSTCSVEPEENAHQVERFLDKHPDWQLCDHRQSLHVLPGDPDGHFAALLVRSR